MNVFADLNCKSENETQHEMLEFRLSIADRCLAQRHVDMMEVEWSLQLSDPTALTFGQEAFALRSNGKPSFKVPPGSRKSGWWWWWWLVEGSSFFLTELKPFSFCLAAKTAPLSVLALQATTGEPAPLSLGLSQRDSGCACVCVRAERPLRCKWTTYVCRMELYEWAEEGGLKHRVWIRNTSRPSGYAAKLNMLVY